MPDLNPKVDAFLGRQTQWRSEFERLRSLILDFPLTEELKWGVPCYTLNGKNVVLIHGFKEYCAILFIKGSLLTDPQRILITQTESVQAGRQVRFTSVAEISALEPVLKAYLTEAVEVEKSGRKVEFKKNPEPIPSELELIFAEQPAVKEAFAALTPGRQRAYILFFSAPKQAQTRVSRIAKSIPQILAGKGLND
jgi:uncharacterized protein YdeI (YjbR/CyaY-like superfamily)